MKVLYWLLMAFFSFVLPKVEAQTFIIDEEFNSGTTPGAGWVFAGGITSSSGSGNFGRDAPNLTLGAAGIITYSWTGAANNADLLTFIYRGNGSAANCAASSILVEESVNGIAWTTLLGTTIQIQSSITSSFKGAVNATSRFIRLTFTQAGTATCYIDDLKIRKAGNCTGDPMIKMILIDGGCVAGCEGGNEFVIAQNGNSPMAIDNLELSIQGPGGVSPKGTVIGANATNTTSIWTKNSTYTGAQLAYITALTGTCSAGTAISVSATNIIPANANMILITGSSPTANYNLNTTCSTGPYYVVFSNLDCTGKFSNSGCTQCYRTISLMNNGTGCVDTKTYTSVSSGSSGTSIVFNTASGAPTETATACTNFAVLPIELLDFYATRNGTSNTVAWKVADEGQVRYYTVEKSNNGVDFAEIGTIVPVNGDINHKEYSLMDEAPYEEITYYRLLTIENSGKIKYYKIISVESNSAEWSYNYYQKENAFMLDFKKSVPENGQINFYDMSGNLLIEEKIDAAKETLYIGNISPGIYHVKIITPYKTESFKAVIYNTN